jgi:hypothetical protein
VGSQDFVVVFEVFVSGFPHFFNLFCFCCLVWFFRSCFSMESFIC